MPRTPSAPVHTPDELLAGARHLLESGDPVMLRAVVLEAISALEAFVHQRVFAALRDKLDPLLVNWLEEKTRMDFESRLSVLTPIATGLPVVQQQELWTRYRRAKKLRNAVTHSGKVVSLIEATEVLRTVHDWLAYLASSAEVDAALAAFKREVETGGLRILNTRSASSAVANYFAGSSPATAALDHYIGNGVRADVVLRFGERIVLIEVKFLSNRARIDIVEGGICQLESAMQMANADRGALVVFSQNELPPGDPTFRSLARGKISVIYIQVQSGDV